VVEHLPSMPTALGSIPSPGKKENNSVRLSTERDTILVYCYCYLFDSLTPQELFWISFLL
jgi:hypothetical protein